MELTNHDQELASEPTAPLGQFFQRVMDARERLLLLDYDGTLAPFTVDPANAVPYSGVCELLNDIICDGTSRVVIITGRPARELPMLLNVRHLPEIWGSHGWERLLPDGDYRCGPLDATALRPVMRNLTWIRDVEHAGARVEHKPCGFAIHWRGLPSGQIGEVRQVAMSYWEALNAGRSLLWEEFDGGVEWKLAGRDKGHSIQTLLRESPDAVAAYLGDDQTDEDAFRALRGRGLGILVRHEHRPTFADWWLRPPEQLLDFLTLWTVLCRGRQE